MCSRPGPVQLDLMLHHETPIPELSARCHRTLYGGGAHEYEDTTVNAYVGRLHDGGSRLMIACPYCRHEPLTAWLSGVRVLNTTSPEEHSTRWHFVCPNQHLINLWGSDSIPRIWL